MIISKSRLWMAAACVALGVAGAAGSGHAQLGPDGNPAPPGAVGSTGGPPAPAPDPVVAAIDGLPVRMSEVVDEISRLPGGAGPGAFAALYPVALQRLVEREVLVQRAHADGLGEDPVVLRHIHEAADRILEEAYLQHATAQRVTEEMLLERYDQEVRGKPGPEEVHGWAILVPTEAEAADIVAKLKAGADFATLAKQVSKDSSAMAGGDMGFVQRASLAPEVGAVLFELQPGQVAPYPVRTLVGWFVLKATARRQAPTPTYAEAHAQLQAEAQRAAVAAVVQAAMRQAQVQTYDVNGGITSEPTKK